VNRCTGVQVHWCAGALVCRCTGVQVHWCAGALVCRCTVRIVRLSGVWPCLVVLRDSFLHRLRVQLLERPDEGGAGQHTQG
jgi:hypothetical protein